MEKCFAVVNGGDSVAARLELFGSCFISRAAKTENPVPRSFFAPKPNGNACYVGYVLGDFANWLGNEAAYVAGA